MPIETQTEKDAELTGTMGLFTTDELANLHRAIVSLVSALDSSAVVRQLVSGSSRVLGAHFGYLLVHRGGGDLTLVEHKGIAKPGRRDTNAEQVFSSGLPAYVSGGAELGASLAGDNPLPKGLVYAPVKGVKGRGIAAILCIGSFDRVFNFKDINALNLLVKPASIVLDNAQLYEKSKEFSRRLRLQTDIQRVLTTVSLDRAYSRFAEALQEVIDFDLALLLGYEPASKAFSVSHAWAKEDDAVWIGRRVRAESSLHANKLGNSVTKLLPELSEEQVSLDQEWLTQSEMQSGVLIRLQRKSTSIGIFSLWSRVPAFFDSSQTELLRWLGRQLALALENHRLFIQLERAKQEWESTFDAMKDAVWITDERGVVRRYNKAFQDALNMSNAEILGVSVADLLQRSEELLTFQQNTDDERFRSELADTPLGRLVEIVGTRLPDTGDAEGGMVFVARDVMQLQQNRSRLEQADRLMALGHLAAAMSHEITNPLSYIKTNLHYLWEKSQALEGFDWLPTSSQNEEVEGNAQDQALRTILEELPSISGESLEGVARVQGVVEKLQIFARGRQEGPGTFSINELVDYCLTLAWALLRPRTEVVTKFSDSPDYYGDQQRLTQVMVNLLVNAAQTMDPASSTKNILEVSTSYENRVHQISITPKNPTNPGSGRRAFEPYFAGEQDLYGSGLGLEISTEIVRDMGGEISHSREEGSDITYTVSLPGRVLRAGSSVGPPISPLAKSTGKTSILVVDDEQFVRRAMRRILSGNHEVELARDVDSALEQLTEHPHPDVILCDVVMPGRSGIDLYEEVQQRWPDLSDSIVFITGGVFNPETEGLLLKSANPVLRKPVEPDLLMSTVQSVVERRVGK